MPSYEQMKARFEAHNTQVLGISTDHHYSHQAWAKAKNISYPLLCDFYPHGAVARTYGVLRDDPSEGSYGACDRVVILVDGEGTIRFINRMPILEIPDSEEIFAAMSDLA